MNKGNINLEPLCETSEKGEKLFIKSEIEECEVEIGKRIVEAFHYLPDWEITFLLKTNSATIKSFTEDGKLPPTEILLSIHKLTGVSIDWLLTGKVSPASNVVKLRHTTKKLQLFAA